MPAVCSSIWSASWSCDGESLRDSARRASSWPTRDWHCSISCCACASCICRENVCWSCCWTSCWACSSCVLSNSECVCSSVIFSCDCRWSASSASARCCACSTVLRSSRISSFASSSCRRWASARASTVRLRASCERPHAWSWLCCNCIASALTSDRCSFFFSSWYWSPVAYVSMQS